MTAREAVTYLNSAISNKCDKALKYLSSAPKIDLVVHTPDLFTSERQAVFRGISLFLDSLAVSSPFREIFLLITNLDKTIFKLPLKFSLFLEDVSIFEKIIREDETLKNKNTTDTFYLLFYCLSKKGYGDNKVLIEDGEISLFAGSHSCVYAAKGKRICWLPFNSNKAEIPYETISDSITDIDDHLIEIGHKYIEEREKLSCFVDVFPS